MERNFYNDEFEELIREKTDQYKMYPSDKVWKEVYNSLHKKRRRFVFGMSVLISGILILAGKELLSPVKPISTKKTITPIASSATDSAKTGRPAVSFIFPSYNKKGAPIQSSDDIADNDNTNDNTNSNESPGFANIASLQPEINEIAIAPDSKADNRILTYIPKAAINAVTIENALPINSNMAPVTASVESSSAAYTDSTDDIAPDQIKPEESAAALRPDEEDKHQSTWLQDYAIQHLSPVRQHTLSLQLYFSPTVNYRQLSGGDYDNAKALVQNVPLALLHIGSADDFVDHTPAVGFELGGSVVYRATRNLSFKAGLQFNYSRYFIKAYTSNLQLATITLNSYYGYLADSLRSYTTLRNFGGKSERTLQNQYFQLSAPLGLELRVMGNGKLQLHVGGTIQPTYLLNRNSYLLTTDYTSYTKEPSLFRRWNVNGSLEAFVSYQVGGLRFQIGPQFRYQLFSTYSSQYPLRENLMEYGLKLGISKALR